MSTNDNNVNVFWGVACRTAGRANHTTRCQTGRPIGQPCHPHLGCADGTPYPFHKNMSHEIVKMIHAFEEIKEKSSQRLPRMKYALGAEFRFPDLPDPDGEIILFEAGGANQWDALRPAMPSPERVEPSRTKYFPSPRSNALTPPERALKQVCAKNNLNPREPQTHDRSDHDICLRRL